LRSLRRAQGARSVCLATQGPRAEGQLLHPHAGPSTNASTTRQTARVTSLGRKPATRPWPPSVPRISSSSSARGLASTATRVIRWCSSSTTGATRSSTSQRACATTAGPASSTRSPSATWFVQTVIVAERHAGGGSRARR